MIYIASDHGGFKLKNELTKAFRKDKIQYTDLGPFEFNSTDDYPDFAAGVAKAVAKNPSSHLGILACRNGQGMCIAANKIPGIRAATAWNEKVAFSVRNDDFANVLCLPADYLKSAEAVKIVKKFINTDFSRLARHGRRIKKVSGLEK